MTNAIIEAAKICLETVGYPPWQVRLGVAAIGLSGIVSGLMGWFSDKRKRAKPSDIIKPQDTAG